MFSGAEFDVDSKLRFGDRCHPLRLPNMGMYLKPYKEVDHCPTYDQSSCTFYLKTNTTIEKSKLLIFCNGNTGIQNPGKTNK